MPSAPTRSGGTACSTCAFPRESPEPSTPRTSRRTNILEDYPDFDLTIFDTRCASAGFGLLVRKLLIMQEHGASREQLLEAADFYRSHIRHVFTVNTLAYLIKGGPALQV